MQTQIIASHVRTAIVQSAHRPYRRSRALRQKCHSLQQAVEGKSSRGRLKHAPEWLLRGSLQPRLVLGISRADSCKDSNIAFSCARERQTTRTSRLEVDLRLLDAGVNIAAAMLEVCLRHDWPIRRCELIHPIQSHRLKLPAMPRHGCLGQPSRDSERVWFDDVAMDSEHT